LAVHVADGTLAWYYELPKVSTWVAPPIIAPDSPDLLIVETGTALWGLSLESGKEKWIYSFP
jgi:outer membrane protein assembly factor BamB